MASFIQLLVISISLAMDAVSVSTAAGIKSSKHHIYLAFKLAFIFGLFQALMPLGGWAAGELLKDIINGIDHWIAFILLSLIGIKMIKESLDQDPEKEIKVMSNKRILMLALATSIDALVVGITLKFIDIPLIASITVIGLVTFLLCLLGFFFGKKVGLYMEGKLEALGGIALILIGLKILLQHLFS